MSLNGQPTSGESNPSSTSVGGLGGAAGGSGAAGATGGNAGHDQPAFRYQAALAQQIETKWQKFWDQQKTFATANPGDAGFDASRPKKYILDMFPYPSGVGLHVGHPLGYIATDIYARYLRMTGHNVLHTMGFDSFGLPAEQYAVQHNQHPSITTQNNIATMRVQLRRLGLGHDPTRSVSTTDEAFYKWTQWIFLQIYNSWYDPAMGKARPISELVAKLTSGNITTRSGAAWASLSKEEQREEVNSYRLAYLADVPVNWCPMLGTVLANEEVTSEGRSERGNYPVYKRPLKQWMMRITAYADRLAADLEQLDWPEAIKLLQRNWIGRSEGALVHFAVPATSGSITVFTTRPDTLFGATYMVLAPDHPLVDEIVRTAKQTNVTFSTGAFPGYDPSASPAAAVQAYRAYAAKRTDRERTDGKTKTGVFTGGYAINPVNGEQIPIFIADYVLSGYGTGAIMAVPAHDERDFEFASAFRLTIRDVVYPRPVMAMRYFAASAFPRGAAGETWRDELADFLGISNATHLHHEPFANLLQTVRTSRRPGGVVMDSSYTHSTSEHQARDDGASRRGSVRMVWVETLDSLGIENFDALHDTLIVNKSYYQERGEPFCEPGVAVNSSGLASAKLPGPALDGLPTAKAKEEMLRWLEASGHGSRSVTYKLRDWLFSRQRYWGEPFPIVHDKNGIAHALPESMLPVLLPELKNFQPESSEDPAAPVRTPLNRAPHWVNVTLDIGDGPKEYIRETNTMPNWAGSCWYYLRYIDPANSSVFCGKSPEHYWMHGGGAGYRHGGVDLYVGGVEHAVLHLLYARFWHKVLFDLAYVSTPEPFQRLFNQGYIQAYAFKDARGAYVEASKVTIDGGGLAMENQDKAGPFYYDGQRVTREYGKMGKSLKNAVSPDEICEQFGCDTLRIYEMSMGPLEASKPWNTRDIAGAFRFLQRLWRNFIDESTGQSRVIDSGADRTTLRHLHKTIAGVRRDMESLGFNTVISKLIELNNHLSGGQVTLDVARAMILMLSPLAPHTAEELWQRVVRTAQPGSGTPTSMLLEPFPIFDPALAADDEIEVPISIMGKPRHRIKVAPNLDAKALEAAALADTKVQELISGKTIKKIIVVPDKMVNLVLE
jgi:leucyl-tRNA synthetase